MAISVAPLTTTVMNAVENSYVGIASGINNAVTRTAGLLAIAVLGLVMSHTFKSNLDRRLTTVHISVEVKREIGSQYLKLAGIEIPPKWTVRRKRRLGMLSRSHSSRHSGS